MYFVLTVLTAVVYAVSAAAAVAPRGAETTRCYTRVDHQPGPCRTTWITTHAPCTRTRTATATVTRRPGGRTTTTIRTSTVTGAVATYTATATATQTITVTATVATTPTTTSTSTVTTTTTIVAPVQSTLPDSSYSGSGGPVVKRNAAAAAAAAAAAGLLPGTSRATYPRSVTCYEWCDGDCHTVTTMAATVTVTRGSASTITQTATVATTVNLSTTTTTTNTVTVTMTPSTVTQTATPTTVTSTATQTATLNAMCSSANFADTVGSQVIGQIDDGNIDNSFDAADVLDCCLQANQGYTGLSAWAFIPGSNTCAVIVGPSMCASEASSTNSVQLGDQGQGQVVVGNGPCGVINSSS